MSRLDSIDLDDIADLMRYPRGAGYVLQFNEADFAAFFQNEFRVNINEDRFRAIGTSKGKRLRSLLTQATDATAARVLEALWRRRAAHLRRSGDADPTKDAEAIHLAMVAKLGGAPTRHAAPPPPPTPPTAAPARVAALKSEIVRISGLAPQPRGYAFEAFLKDLFDTYRLEARQAFKNTGEQIDGSFVLGSAAYLLEAKWQADAFGAGDLHAFEGKLRNKAEWARGLFLSHSGFTDVGLEAFERAKRTVCMDGLDLYDMLNGDIPFDRVIERKARRAAESGAAFVRVRDLF